MKNNRPQAKDISDAVCLAARDAVARKKQEEGDGFWRSRPIDDVWTCTWDIEVELKDFPPKVVAAKLATMARRGILDGCSCGCRGDWVVLRRDLVKPTKIS